MIESRTEDSVTDLLASFLRQRGFDATTQISVRGEDTRKQPDIRIVHNGKVYYGEAKWDTDYWKGIGEANDYNKIQNASGTFAIAYPLELKKDLEQKRLVKLSEIDILKRYQFRAAFLFKDDRPTDFLKRGSLKDFINWLKASFIEKREVTPDISEMINVLKETVNSLTYELGDSDLKEDLFRNVIGGSPEKDDKELTQATRNAAGYLLVNQVVFYRVLSSTGKYPEIRTEALHHPSDLQDKYFNTVLKHDYTPVFGAMVAIDFSDNAMETIKSAIRTIYGIKPEKIKEDVLGKVFHKFIPLDVRKKVAAYYTLNESAKILSKLSINDPNIKVIDPACGSGTLLVSAYDRKRELIEAKRQFTPKDHRNFVQEDITGIDVMPFAGHLSVIHLALQKPLYETEKVQVGIIDSTRLEKGVKIKTLERILPEAEQGQQKLEDFLSEARAMDKRKVDRNLDIIAKEEISIDEYDLVIMNPPFTRFQKVSGFGKDYSERLEKRLSRYSKMIDQKMGYYAYFLLIADKIVKDDGKIAAVLPYSILRGHSTKEIRKYIQEHYNIEYIIVREDQPNFSEDTALREILFIVSKGRNKDNLTSFVTLRKLDSEITHKITRARERNKDGQTYEDNDFNLKNISQSKLDYDNLFQYISFSSPTLFSLTEEINKKNLQSFEQAGFELETHDSPPRGGATFSGFCINEPSATKMRSDKWQLVQKKDSKLIVTNRFVDKKFEIPLNSVVPALRRLAHNDCVNVSDRNEYVVTSPFSEMKEFVNLSDIKKMNWDIWKEYVKGRMSHLAVGSRFDLSAPGTKLLAFYSSNERAWARAGNCVVKHPNKNESKILALWYNSVFNIMQILRRRQETRGAYMQLNKFILKYFRIPKIKDIRNEDRERLVKLFDSVSKVKMPSIYEQLAMNCNKSVLRGRETKKIISSFDVDEIIGKGFKPRIEIDKAFRDILKIDVDLNELYGKVLYEIAVLKEMMIMP